MRLNNRLKKSKRISSRFPSITTILKYRAQQQWYVGCDCLCPWQWRVYQLFGPRTDPTFTMKYFYTIIFVFCYSGRDKSDYITRFLHKVKFKRKVLQTWIMKWIKQNMWKIIFAGDPMSILRTFSRHTIAPKR